MFWNMDFFEVNFCFCLILSGSFSPWSINIRCNDSDAKQWLNNWTMENWTQARHPVFGAKLSRLQTLSTRANTQITQIGRKQKLDCFVQKSSFCFLPICVVCLFARAERVCSRDNFAPKTSCLAWLQSSIVQLLSHCFASLSLHRILIDQGENDPLKIRQKKNFEK